MNSLFCGIDLGTRSSAICVINGKKQVLKQCKVTNNKLSDTIELIKGNQKMFCIVESGPLAESICNKVEGIGAEIEIVDSRHTKALLHGKKKTDRIDAHVLAELACMGWYKPVYRKEGNTREKRILVQARSQLVKVCTTLKNTIRGLLKSLGIVLPVGQDGKKFFEAVTNAIADLTPEVKGCIVDLLTSWRDAHQKQLSSYKRLYRLAKEDEVAKRLMTVPGVGPATALCFAGTIATHARFKESKQVVGYLGLAPIVHQSGDTYFHGRITKKGDKLLRWLLVEAAGVMLSRVKTSFPLRDWGLQLAKAKGVGKARVAVARRLAILLFTLWKNGKDFQLNPTAEQAV